VAGHPGGRENGEIGQIECRANEAERVDRHVANQVDGKQYDQVEIEDRKDPQRPSNIEFSKIDIRGVDLFFQEQGGYQESADDEKESYSCGARLKGLIQDPIGPGRDIAREPKVRKDDDQDRDRPETIERRDFFGS
jgi:hypothetical protein